MNTIKALPVKSFSKNILSIYIDKTPLSEILSDITGNAFYKDLWCSWLMARNNNPWEQHCNYIWSLLDNNQNCNIPILICPDDMDFWCTVVVAQVRYLGNIVEWEKIGLVTGAINVEQWRKSGIQNIEKWSESDWESHAGTLAWLSPDDKAWEEWWSEHWLEEENRRLWNYFHPYFNDDKNIDWIYCNKLSFDRYCYDKCVSAFKTYEITS